MNEISSLACFDRECDFLKKVIMYGSARGCLRYDDDDIVRWSFCSVVGGWEDDIVLYSYQ